MKNVLVFSVSGFLFGLEYQDVHEIIHYVNLLEIPGMPTLFKGFVNLGGDIIPILRFNELMGGSLKEVVPGGYTPIILLNPKPSLGILIDEVKIISQIEINKIHPLSPEDIFNACVKGVFLTASEEKVYLLDINKILLEKEKIKVFEFRKIAEERVKAIGNE